MATNQSRSNNPIECIDLLSDEEGSSRMEIDDDVVYVCTTSSTEAPKEPQPEVVDLTNEESDDEVIVLEERPQAPVSNSTQVITPAPMPFVAGSQSPANVVHQATPAKLQELPDFESSVVYDSTALTATVMDEEMPEEPPMEPTKLAPYSILMDHDYFMTGVVSENDGHVPSTSSIIASVEYMEASDPLRALENHFSGAAETVMDEVMTDEPATSEPLPSLKKKTGSSRKKSNNGGSATPSKRRCLRAPKEIEPASEAPEATSSEIPAPLGSSAPTAEPTTGTLDFVASAPVPPRSPKEVTFSTPFWLRRLPYSSTPTGLSHTAFHAKPPMEDYPGIFAKLNILEEKDFPKCVAPGVKFTRRNDEEDTPKYYDLVESSGSNLKQLDENHHATLEDYRGPMADRDYMESEDREEVIWSHEELESQLRHNEMKLDTMYDSIQNDYIFAVWRQFEGHIPAEVALQHLRTSQFNVARALDTVDQCLETLPQKMKDPCIAQIQLFQQEQKKLSDGMDLRFIQEHVMRNFHLPEIHQYFYNFRKFFGVDDDRRENKGAGGLTGTIGCNCNEPMCRELDFEPRFGCSNCTRKMRKSKLPADKLCLICKTYTKITGNPRPAKAPVFDKNDLERIRLWDTEECRSMSREDFEKWHQEEKNKKWRALEVTKEESLMLNFSRLKLNGKNTLGDQVTSMLQPYKLPHFARCQCSKSGGIPNGSKNFGKSTFTPEEIERFTTAIANTPGDIKSAAMALEVEEELVEMFLKKYKARDLVWQNLAKRLKVHNYKARIVLPPINSPPIIPKIGSVQK